MSGIGLQCICEICCCGRHRCPHRPKASVPWGPCVMSEYAAQYHPHCFDPVHPIPPVSNIFNCDAPMSKKTTHRTDYVPHPFEAPHIHKPTPYKAPEGKMENTTLYRKEYTPKYCPPSEPVKPYQPKMCPAKFDGQPTYRTDYRPWDICPVASMKPKAERPPLPKFDAEPVYRREYIPHCITKTPIYKPPPGLPPCTEPFKGETIYRSEYTAPCIEPREEKKAPVLIRSSAPFEKLTTHRKDFTEKEMCPVQPIRPPPSVFTSSGPMSKNTTNRTDYKDWGPIIPERSTAPPYKPPEGDRYLDSTYRNDFAEKPICPVLTIKPPEARRCEAKFDGSTNYRNDYVPWDVKPLTQQKPREWHPPTVPFDDLTTNRTAYIPPPCVPVPQSYKPTSTLCDSGPFDGRTNYRTEYVPKEVCPCCPAQFLNQEKISPDGYKFEKFDEAGHQKYRNVAGGIGSQHLLPELPVKGS